MRLPIPLGEMESAGMEEDEEYSERLSYKYNKQLDEVDAQIAEELLKFYKIDSEAIYQKIKELV